MTRIYFREGGAPESGLAKLRKKLRGACPRWPVWIALRRRRDSERGQTVHLDPLGGGSEDWR